MTNKLTNQTFMTQNYHQFQLPNLANHMSRYQPNSVSPIKMLNLSKPSSFQTPKPYETPAKYLTQRNQTIYEEEYYKEKSQRLQKVVKELKEEVGILQTQNKQLKTQIQIYRDSKGSSSYNNPVSSYNNSVSSYNNPVSSYNNPVSSHKPQSSQDPSQVQRLLKQIRILKNNHEMQLTQSKNQHKKLNKKLLELQDQLHQNQLSWQSKSQQSQGKVQQRNKQLQKEIKQLRKSVVEYMEQRDQNQHKLENMKRLLEEKDTLVKQAQHRERTIMEEKVSLEEKLNQYLAQQSASNKQQQAHHRDPIEQGEQSQMKNSQRQSRRRDQLYQFGVNSIRRNPNKQSHFSVHTFNGTRHVPAQQVFDVVESFKSQIHRLQAQLQRNAILHVKEKDDLGYMVERYQKELKEKDNDIVSLLTKVKPLMSDRNRVDKGKEAKEGKKDQFQEEKENVGRNAFGLRMLQMFLKKYKMEAF